MLRFGRDSRSAHPRFPPPRLRTLADAEEERHASWLELFFDLVFVVAIAELSHELVVNHTLNGFAIFAALFVPVFVAWQGFSFYADRFDTDDVLFRVSMLIAMLAVAALAIQIPSATHGASTGFALAYVAIRSLTVALNLRAYRHVSLARPLIGRYVVAFSFSVALWTVSLAVPEPWRFLLWGIGLAADLGVPALIGPRFVGRVPIHASHIPERFALFTMIVLGESVVAVALGVAGSDWELSSAAGAALGFLAVACLWWTYFDVGAAVYLCCTSVIQDATARGILRTILGLRLSVVALLVALAFLGAGLRPVTFAAVMVALLVALVAFEISRNLRPDAHRRPKPSAD